MASSEHLALLERGVDAWNDWRETHPEIRPDLAGCDLSGKNLRNINFSRANLRASGLYSTVLDGADLSGADLLESKLRGTKLRGADLSGARLMATDLNVANFKNAKLQYADLSASVMIGTNLEGADLSNCNVYGISVWDVFLDGATQINLLITAPGTPEIQVDNLEVAQFIHLLLNNQQIRSVIDTITSKVVLILGRFTPERKAVLDALRDELRRRNYLPVVFDFEKPESRTTDETITLLARMARFVVLDISDAKSILQELRAIVPVIPSVAVQPLILASQEEPGMFDFYRNYPWFLKTHRYATTEQLVTNLTACVILPAEAKVQELRGAQHWQSPS